MSILSKFFKLTRQDRRFFFEAAYETLLARVVTTIFRARTYTSWLGQQQTETETTEPSAYQKEQIMQTKVAMVRCRHLIWARKCLVESVAAKRMLQRRNIPATLYMGIAKNKFGKMMAHAWLRSGNIWVAGGRNRHQYTVVGFFS